MSIRLGLVIYRFLWFAVGALPAGCVAYVGVTSNSRISDSALLAAAALGSFASYQTAQLVGHRLRLEHMTSAQTTRSRPATPSDAFVARVDFALAADTGEAAAAADQRIGKVGQTFIDISEGRAGEIRVSFSEEQRVESTYLVELDVASGGLVERFYGLALAGWNGAQRRLDLLRPLGREVDFVVASSAVELDSLRSVDPPLVSRSVEFGDSTMKDLWSELADLLEPGDSLAKAIRSGLG